MQRKLLQQQDEPAKANPEVNPNPNPVIVGLTYPDMSKFNHYLTEATFQSCGGFRLLPANKPAYSPIDLTVALYESYLLDEILDDLKQFFLTHKVRQSENIVHADILYNGIITCQSITEWKHTCQTRVDSKLLDVLIRNAPFTMQ